MTEETKTVRLTTTLYHGSNGKVSSVSNAGMFGGVFASADEQAAASHGPVLNIFEIPDDLMLSNFTLNYELDDEALDTIRAVLLSELALGADIEEAWEIVVESPGVVGAHEAVELFRGAEDAASAGWEAQRIRGRIAAALGYAAVEMEDEHGTTWLIVGEPRD